METNTSGVDGVVGFDSPITKNAILESLRSATYSAPVMPPKPLVTSFSMRPDGSIMWSNAPYKDPVELVAEEVIDREALINDSPSDLDAYIKLSLARKLAEMILEEDLIEIQSNNDITSNNVTFRAKIKLIQE